MGREVVFFIAQRVSIIFLESWDTSCFASDQELRTTGPGTGAGIGAEGALYSYGGPGTSALGWC